MERSADVKHHPGYHAKFSLPTGRCSPKVHIKIADIARFRFSQHPYFYPPLCRFLGHVLSEEYLALEFDHCFIDTHIPNRDVMCQEVVMTQSPSNGGTCRNKVCNAWPRGLPPPIESLLSPLKNYLSVCNATYAPPLLCQATEHFMFY